MQLSRVADRGRCYLLPVVESCLQRAVTMIYSDLGLIPLVIDKVSCQLSRQIQFQLNPRNLVSAQCDLIQTANIHGKKYFDERFFLFFLFHR